MRQADVKYTKDCKVVLGESVIKQNHVPIIDVQLYVRDKDKRKKTETIHTNLETETE